MWIVDSTNQTGLPPDFYQQVVGEPDYTPICGRQGGRSCGKVSELAEKFGLGRKFEAPTYAILSLIKICSDLRTFW